MGCVCSPATIQGPQMYAVLSILKEHVPKFWFNAGLTEWLFTGRQYLRVLRIELYSL